MLNAGSPRTQEEKDSDLNVTNTVSYKSTPTSSSCACSSTRYSSRLMPSGYGIRHDLGELP